MTDRRAPAIPDVQGLDPATSRILTPMRAQLNLATMKTGTAIEPLPDNATLTDVINRINALINHFKTI